MWELFDDLVAALFKSALIAIFGYLVGHHVILPEDGERYVREFGKHAGYVAGLLMTVGWVLWTRYKGRLKFLAALQLPEGATEADAKALRSEKGTDLLKKDQI